MGRQMKEQKVTPSAMGADGRRPLIGGAEECPGLDNDMIIAHFLSCYYVPGIVQSALHT